MSRFNKLLLVSALAFMLVIVGCSKEESPTQSVQNQESEIPTYDGEFTSVRLDKPVRLGDLESYLADVNIPLEEFRIESAGITIGYTVAGRDIASALDDFRREHKKFLDALDQRLANDGESVAQAAEVSAIRLVDADLQVSVLSFRGEESDVQQAIPASAVDENVLVAPAHEITGSLALEKGSSSSTALSISHERWAAYGGESVITRNYTYQKFIFNNVSDYGSNRTYEHETQIYDRNYADYAGYWSTNLPYGYKDTQFGDNIDNFTVGCARANYLRTYTWYWTYMSLRPQSSSSALCHVRGQIGHRWPSWCTSTWCIYADATTYPGSYAYLALPNYGISWQY